MSNKYKIGETVVLKNNMVGEVITCYINTYIVYIGQIDKKVLVRYKDDVIVSKYWISVV